MHVSWLLMPIREEHFLSYYSITGGMKYYDVSLVLAVNMRQHFLVDF